MNQEETRYNNEGGAPLPRLEALGVAAAQVETKERVDLRVASACESLSTGVVHEGEMRNVNVLEG